MAYDPDLKFRPLENSIHAAYLNYFEIPISPYLCAKEALAGFEPEVKIVGDRGIHNSFVTYVEHSPNACFIAGQSYKKSAVLISANISDIEGLLRKRGYNLRVRLNLNLKTFSIPHADITLKSRLDSVSNEVIGGMVMRDEHEAKLDLQKPIVPQIMDFLAKVSKENPHILCGDIHIGNARVTSLIHSRRVDDHLLVADKSDKSALAFHICRDTTIFTDPHLNRTIPGIQSELEAEVLAGYGLIPSRYLNHTDGGIRWLTDGLNGLRGDLLQKLPVTEAISKSKGEQAEAGLISNFGDVFNHHSTFLHSCPTVEDFMNAPLNPFFPIAKELMRVTNNIIVPEGGLVFGGGRCVNINPHRQTQSINPSGLDLNAA